MPVDELDEPAGIGVDSGFFGDAGPEFSPETSPEVPEPDEVAPEVEIGWTPDGVAEFLRSVQAPAFNALLNPLLKVEKVDWTHREARLAQVAPAIAREWNKMPRVRALAGHTDRGLILSYLILEYLGPRSFAVVSERRENAEAAALEEQQQPLYTAEEWADAGQTPPDVAADMPRATGLPPRRR